MGTGHMSRGSPTRENLLSYANQMTVKTWPWAHLLKATSFAREQEVMQLTQAFSQNSGGRGENAGVWGKVRERVRL